MNEIRVNLGERSYYVFVGAGAAGGIADWLKGNGYIGKIGIISDENTAKLYLNELETQLKESGFETMSVKLKPGEATKSLSEVGALYDVFLAERWEREWSIIALGGGVIGDITGYLASTLLRGVPFIQIPSSLLAQVDSSVGGKVGINHEKGKNLIGAFYQPSAVFADIGMLKTLPKREIYCGLAEIVKCALISDARFAQLLFDGFEGLADLSDIEFTESVVSKCVRFKAEVVSADEREGGIRRILNFGHTFGHGVETALGHGMVTHGEAVAFGIRCAILLSGKLGMLNDDEEKFVLKLLDRIPVPQVVYELEPKGIVDTMKSDKKVRDGDINLVLLDGIGEAVVNAGVEERLIIESIRNARGMI